MTDRSKKDVDDGASLSLSVGMRLGPYEILAPLGAGGMGEVYRARDRRLERDVALKVLPAHLAGDPVSLARFEREAKLLAALSHPNILTIFDVGAEAGTSFVVTELLRGESLRARVARAALPWREAREVALAVAEGLAAAHSKSVVHGDVKPDNVFVTADGLVKILDFGLGRFEAAAVDTSTQVITKVAAPRLEGTVPYMAPERVKGEAPDARSDLFSFGCTLFEMLTGRTPFTGKSLAEIMAAILRDPAPFAEASAGIPGSLDQVMRACLRKDPQDRIESAAALVMALRAVSTDAPAPVARVAPPAKRRRTSAIDSVAVLPFVDDDATPETEYVCDGLTDRIIDTLSRIPKLRVMAHATVFRYKGRAVDPRAAGQELGVRAVLTGRAVRRGEAWTLQLELVDVLDGARLGGTQRSFDKRDLSELPEQIVLELSKPLRLGRGRSARQASGSRSTESSEAFRLYLQGRFFWNKRTRDGLLRSLEAFERAAQEDPQFPLARAGLADAYAMLGGFGYLPPQEAYTKARIEATKALELDPSLAEAHGSLGLVKYRFEWDWEGAEHAFQRALESNPGYAMAHTWYGVYLVLMGRFDEGTRAITRALELDPLSVVTHWTYGYLLYYMRRFDDALAQYERTLALDPTFARVHFDVGIVHALRGRVPSAVMEIQKTMDLLEQSPSLLASLGWVYGVSGDRAEALRILEELRGAAKRQPVSPFTVALIHVALRDFESAFEQLERSFERREDALVSLKVNPRVDPLRADPRFADLVRRVGLPD